MNQLYRIIQGLIVVLSKDYVDILVLTCIIQLPHMVTQNLVKATRKSCLYIQVQAYTHL